MGLLLHPGLLQYGSVAHHASLSLASGFTIETYFRVIAPIEDTVTTYLISKGAVADLATGWNYSLHLKNASGNYSALTLSGTVGDGAGSGSTVSGPTYDFTRGQWFQGAVTYDGTNLKLWLRPPGGTYAQFGSTTASVAPATNSLALLIGAKQSAAGVVAALGCIALDEIRVWNTARNLATLQAASKQRLVGNESGLVWYARTDDGMDGTDGILTDRSRGNGRNATLVNGPTWTDSPRDLLYPAGLHTPEHCGSFGWLSGAEQPGATFSASSEDTAGDRTAENLRSPRQSRKLRSSGLSTWRVVVGIGRRLPTAAIGIDNHNLTSAATLLLEMNDADSWSSPPVSEVVTYHPRRIRHFLARPYDYPFLRLTVTDAANPAGYMEIGTLHPWVEEEFDSLPMSAVRIPTEDPSVVVETPHGQLVVRKLAGVPSLDIDFMNLRRHRARRMREILSLVGAGAPVQVWTDATRKPYGPEQIYGYIRSAPAESLGGNPTGLWADLPGLSIYADRP